MPLIHIYTIFFHFISYDFVYALHSSAHSWGLRDDGKESYSKKNDTSDSNVGLSGVSACHLSIHSALNLWVFHRSWVRWESIGIAGICSRSSCAFCLIFCGVRMRWLITWLSNSVFSRMVSNRSSSNGTNSIYATILFNSFKNIMNYHWHKARSITYLTLLQLVECQHRERKCGKNHENKNRPCALCNGRESIRKPR